MAPVAGHLTPDTNRSHPPGHPVRPLDDVAAHRTGPRKQPTVNPPIVPARYNLLYPSFKAGPAAGVIGRQNPGPQGLMGREAVSVPNRIMAASTGLWSLVGRVVGA